MSVSGFALQPQSLGEQAAAALRNAILSGQFAPGEALREAALARDLGVARNTVREALRILAGERLVSYQLHHGVVVSTLTENDIIDLYGVRALLEPAALLDFTNHRPENIQAVLDAVQQLEDATNRSDLNTVVEHDLDFHRSLVALRNSERVNEFFADICAEVRRCAILVIFADGEHEPTSRNVDEHRLVADALVARDYQRAANLALAHVNTTRDRALQLIRSRVSSGDAHTPEQTDIDDISLSRPKRSIPRRARRSSTTNSSDSSERKRQ